MKKFCILIFVVSVLFSVNVTAQDKVVLSNGEWKPYLSKDLKHSGVASHIVTEAFKKEGVAVEFKWYGESWKRAYKDAKTGKVNGSLIWSKKPEREAEMFFSDAVLSGKKDVFFHLKKNKFTWKTIDDLKGKKISGVLGYTYGGLIDDAEKKGIIKLERVAHESLNLKKLLKGRIDLLLTGEVIGEKLIKETLTPAEAEMITFNSKPVREATYHLILTRSISANKAIIEKFNVGLKKLKDEGLYDKYIQDSKDGKYEK